MAHIGSITAGIYTSIAYNSTPVASLGSVDTAAEVISLFSSAPVEIKNIREFPQIGTPANIVNVPVYGQKTSVQVQGQADSPTLEFTINYVPADMTALQALVGNGQIYAFQIALCSQKPANLQQTASTGIGSTVNSIATQNTVFNFAGKFEALLISPQLTDANQCTLTLSMQTELFGPATYA